MNAMEVSSNNLHPGRKLQNPPLLQEHPYYVLGEAPTVFFTVRSIFVALSFRPHVYWYSKSPSTDNSKSSRYPTGSSSRCHRRVPSPQHGELVDIHATAQAQAAARAMFYATSQAAQARARAQAHARAYAQAGSALSAQLTMQLQFLQGLAYSWPRT